MNAEVSNPGSVDFIDQLDDAPIIFPKLSDHLDAAELVRSRGANDYFNSDTKRLIGEKCGIFGCVANGEWPTALDVANIIHLGLVGLQHR